MLDAILHLRAFAISLAGNISYADDLVQATLLRSPENRDGFHPSTARLVLHNPAQPELSAMRCAADSEGAEEWIGASGIGGPL